MKKYILSLVIIIGVVLNTGCSSEDSSILGILNENSIDINRDMVMYGGWDDGAVTRSARSYVAPETATGEMFEQLSAEPQQTVHRMIIRNARMKIEVGDVNPAYENILASLERHGGFEANKTLESWDNYINIWAELRVPAQNLDAFLREIAQEGEVRSQNIYSSDITDQYFDSQTRLETLERTLERYFEFLEGARNITEQLEITRHINDITFEIESLKGSLSRWGYLVAYSSVSINLHATPEIIIERREIEWASLSLDDMSFLIRNGLVGITSFLFNLLQRIIIALIVSSPITLPVALLIFLLVRRSKKKRLARIAARQEIQNQEPSPNINTEAKND